MIIAIAKISDNANRIALVGKCVSFLLAASLTSILSLTITFVDSFHSLRFAPILLLLLFVHLCRFSQILVSREAGIYIAFFCYMLLQLAWTLDIGLAINTIAPAANCILIIILCGSLIKYHDTGAVLSGMVTGVVLGAILYTGLTDFPFAYPEKFSYNAVALIYLFGMLIALLGAGMLAGSRSLFVLALVFWVHIVATTSIKTNLGIIVGFVYAVFWHGAYFRRLIRRRFILILIVIGSALYLGSSSPVIDDALDRGLARLSLGLQVLQARDDIEGYSAFRKRDAWLEAGIAGWKRNPLFGHGVEAFRSKFGITSHSTPVDLLYNSGLLGAVLFYFFLGRLLIRTYTSHCSVVVRMVLASGWVCFSFITLSGTMHYSYYLAAFAGVSIGLTSKPHVLDASISQADLEVKG